MPGKADQGHGPVKHFISPDRFFSSDAEKTKLNWFLFEFALESESSLRGAKRLRRRLAGKGVDDARLADFCVQHAKHMKQEILERLAGRTQQVRIDYEQIERLLPEIGDRLVDEVLTVLAKAWDSQTEACAACPTRCISDRDARAPMFDDPSYRQ